MSADNEDHTMRNRLNAVRVLTSVLILFPLLGTGCADLSAIQEFASISARSAEYTGLVDQYVGSPARQKRFQPPDQQEQLDQTTRLRAAQRERLLLRLRVVAEYMNALGQLAADDVVDFDKGIGELKEAVVENKFAGEKDAGAFSSVSNVLVRVCTDGWRKKELKNLIAESNGPFQEIVGALQIIVQQDFPRDIANEEEAMTKYYQTLIHSSSDRAGIAALAEWEETRMAEAAARARSDSCYSQVLSKISSGHQQLFEKRDDLGSQELVRQLTQYASELRNLFNSIKSL